MAAAAEKLIRSVSDSSSRKLIVQECEREETLTE